MNYLLDVFLETHFEHLVSFIENQTLQTAKVDVSSLNVVKHSPSCSNENINTISQILDLLLDINSSVDSDDFEFVVVVFERVHNIADLCKSN